MVTRPLVRLVRHPAERRLVALHRWQLAHLRARRRLPAPTRLSIALRVMEELANERAEQIARALLPVLS
jgi:hypothetical protein